MKSAVFLSIGAVTILLLSTVSAGAQLFFPHEAIVPAGGSPGSIATGDLNNDGHADMAVVDWSVDSVFVFLGNGDTTFQGAVEYLTGENPVWVSIGDLDEDGDLDMVVVNEGNHSTTTGDISVFAGNGDGTFQTSVHFGASDEPQCVLISDFDGDGNEDLAVGHIGVNHVSILLGNGDCTFLAAVNYEVGYRPRSIATGDLNNDTIPDLAAANASNFNVSILLGNGDGTFTAAGNYLVTHTPFGVAIGDLDEDGNLDLAVVHLWNVSVAVLMGNGDGTFQPSVYIDIGCSTNYMVLIDDFNEDGILDLAVPNTNCRCVVFLLGRGDGTFEAPVEHSTGERTSEGAVLDVDGDGHLDLAINQWEIDAVAVLVNTADTTISAELTCSPSTGSLPYTIHLSAAVSHDFYGEIRQIAARIDLRLAGGGGIKEWREGNAGVPFGVTINPAWNQVIPNLGSLVGDNTFELVAEDVTYAPYNQPPFLPSGQTDSASCVVTAYSP